MSDPFSNPWKRAVAWVIPILLRLAQASAAAAAAMALVYHLRVPRRLKAGVRGFALAVVIAVVLGGAWLLLALSGMPRLG